MYDTNTTQKLIETTQQHTHNNLNNINRQNYKTNVVSSNDNFMTLMALVKVQAAGTYRPESEILKFLSLS